MRLAARLHGVGDVRVEAVDHDVPVPPGWSTVAIASVGICGSDLHWFEEGGIGDATLRKPVVPGHEMAGTVVSGPLRGRRVAIDPAIPCDSCEVCRAGHGNLCPDV